ncbi:Hypothetical predicted protein [Mytilus galloprovincialis]|uniref:Uncharacterized protein n=1 Tax=Mytilus galloprovincialis TaxID=29158 RepID=A0A8B6CFB9_MYTGA|nr:Hypothetical predicted protein [Mytilus galloprovincialis]
MARKRVNAEVQRTKLQYAEQQTKLIKQKARLSELETQSKALKDREKAEVDADLALLKQQTEAAVAEVEVKVLEEAESDRRSLSLQEDKEYLQKVKMTLTEKYVNEQFNEVEQLKSQDKNNNVPQDIPNNQDKFSSHAPAPRNQLNIIPTPRNLPKFQVDDLDRSIVEDIKPEIRQKQTLNPYAADFELTQPPLPPNHDQSVVSDLTKFLLKKDLLLSRFQNFDDCINTSAIQYTMSSCAGRTIMNGRCAESLIVESLSGNGELEIHSVIECSAIPDEKSEIPTPDIAKSYPHLREIAHQIPNRQRLPNNRSQAWKRAQILDKSFQQNFTKKTHFVEFMQKVLVSGAAEVAPIITDEECWYLPLFGVYHQNKPNQIRGVFDSSASFEGVSLNSVMMSGPDLTNNLLGILLRFRSDQFAATADIEQMFYQFYVREEDRNFLRFFWYKDNNPDNPLIEHRMCVNVFGNSASPAVATYGLRKTVENSNETFGSDVKTFVNRDFYVDDGLISLPESEQVIDLITRTQMALKRR